MPSFKQILLQEVAPALKALSYEYDDALRDRQLSFAFKRVGTDGIERTITYLRRQHEEKPVGFGFTIELHHTPGPRRIHGYELGHLLWHAYGLRIDRRLSCGDLPITKNCSGNSRMHCADCGNTACRGSRRRTG